MRQHGTHMLKTPRTRVAGTLGAHQLAGAQEALQLGGVVQGAHHRPLHVRIVQLRQGPCKTVMGAHVMEHVNSGCCIQWGL